MQFTQQQACDLIKKYLDQKDDFKLNSRDVCRFNLEEFFRSQYYYDFNRPQTHKGFKAKYLDVYGSGFRFECYFMFYFSPLSEPDFVISATECPWIFNIFFRKNNGYKINHVFIDEAKNLSDY